jgi:hypothetical protein
MALLPFIQGENILLQMLSLSKKQASINLLGLVSVTVQILSYLPFESKYFLKFTIMNGITDSIWLVV